MILRGAQKDKGLLVLQPAFLGDVVLSTALVESWHRAFPDEPIEVLVRKGASGFFEGHPFVRHVHEWDREGWRKYPRLWELAQACRKGRPRFVANAHRYGSMGWLANRVGADGGASFDSGTMRARPGWRTVVHGIGDGRHETQRNHELIAEEVGAFDPIKDRPRLHFGEKHLERAAAWPVGGVVLAPASVWRTKRWPVNHWAALVDALHDGGQTVILLGGKGDGSLLQSIATQAKAEPSVCAGGLDLLSSAALMKASSAVISNDSAPLHMAGAVGTPVVGVFCSTTPRFGFGPLPADLVLGRAETVEISEEALDCKPCGLHGHAACPAGHFRCGEALGVDAVLSAWRRVSSLPS